MDRVGRADRPSVHQSPIGPADSSRPVPRQENQSRPKANSQDTRRIDVRPVGRVDALVSRAKVRFCGRWSLRNPSDVPVCLSSSAATHLVSKFVADANLFQPPPKCRGKKWDVHESKASHFRHRAKWWPKRKRRENFACVGTVAAGETLKSSPIQAIGSKAEKAWCRFAGSSSPI